MVALILQSLCQTACNKGRDECKRRIMSGKPDDMCIRGAAICMKSCSLIPQNERIKDAVKMIILQSQGVHPAIPFGGGVVIGSGSMLFVTHVALLSSHSHISFGIVTLMLVTCTLVYYKYSIKKDVSLKKYFD